MKSEAVIKTIFCQIDKVCYSDGCRIRIQFLTEAAVLTSLGGVVGVLTGILLVYALIIMIAPQLYESVRSLWISIPDKINRFVQWATDRFGDEEMVARVLTLLNTNSESIYEQLETWGKNLISPYLTGLTSIVSGVGSSLIKILKFLYNLLIGLIVACYLLASRKRFARQSVMVVRSLLKPRWADLFLGEVAFVDRMFGGFIDGKLLAANLAPSSKVRC